MAYVLFVTGSFLRGMLVLVGEIVAVASVAPNAAAMSDGKTERIADMWAKMLPDGPVTWLTVLFTYGLWAAAALGLAILGLIVAVGVVQARCRGRSSESAGDAWLTGGPNRLLRLHLPYLLADRLRHVVASARQSEARADGTPGDRDKAGTSR